MNLIKFSKKVECFIRAILYPKSRIAFVCDDEHEAKDCFIKFKNGSSIEILRPHKEEFTARGRRASISPWFYDFESNGIIDEDLDKILDPFMVKDPPDFKQEYDCIWCSSRKENDI